MSEHIKPEIKRVFEQISAAPAAEEPPKEGAEFFDQAGELKKWLLAQKDLIDQALMESSAATVEESPAKFYEYLKNLEAGEQPAENLAAMAKIVNRNIKAMVEWSGKDKLTCLHNRAELFNQGADYFDEVEQESDPAQEKTLSVISLDIDFFKAYNDVCHTFGDVALQRVGLVLLDAVKKQNGIGVRLGGEEIFLVVKKKLPLGEVEKLAEDLRQTINNVLRELFSQYDQEKQGIGFRPDISTLDYLEERVLSTKRGREGVNREMQAKAPALAQAKQFALDNNLLADSDVEIEPADLILLLKNTKRDLEKNQAKTPEQAKQLAAVVQILDKELGFGVGSATIGASHIEFDEPTVVNPDDLAMIRGELYKNNQPEPAGLAAKKYPEIYQALADYPELVKKIKKSRFGRIVDNANEIAEKQKAQKRNSSVVMVEKLSRIDQALSQAVKPELQAAYNQTAQQLDSLSRERFDGAPDEVAKMLALITKHDSKNPLWPELQQVMTGIQRERYLDPLTRAKNYQYLVNVLPEQAKQLREKNQDLSVISFDMDNLKAINEAGGHKLGDVVLMKLSLILQEKLAGLNNEQIKASGFEPELIRATGGEEFIITLPGLNSREAHEVFLEIQQAAAQAIRQFIAQELNNQPGQAVSEEELKIKEYLKTQGRTGAGLEEFGTLTAGIASMNQLVEAGVDIITNGKINVGLMRQIADEVGERLKKEDFGDGRSGRGHVWEFEVYQQVKKLDQMIAGLALVQRENHLLKDQLAEYEERFKIMRRELQQAKEQVRIQEIKQDISRHF